MEAVQRPAACLLTVEATFVVTGRGAYFAAVQPTGQWGIKPGYAVTVERLDGSTLQTHVQSATIPRTAPPNSRVVVQLGPEVTTEMAPPGTKLWIRSET